MNLHVGALGQYQELLEVVRDLPIHQDYRLLLKKEPHQLDRPKVLDQEQ
jgi:hypothetical protein